MTPHPLSRQRDCEGKPDTRWRRRAKITEIFCACFLAGCAAQGPPRPPRLEKPERIKDLTVTQIGRSLELRFTPPALATDGERLSRPLEIDIFRSISAPGARPATIAPAQAPWTTLQPKDWPALLRPQAPTSQPGSTAGTAIAESGNRTSPGQQKNASAGPGGRKAKQGGFPSALEGKRKNEKQKRARNLAGSNIVYRYNFSEGEFNQFQGSTFAFAARGLTRGFAGRPIAGDLSKTMITTLLDVSPPVQNVVAEQPTEHALQIRWSPPTRSLSGHPISRLAGYRIYKSAAGQADSFRQLGETSAATFQDTNFRFGQTYFYRVRALFQGEDQVAESEDSLSAQITPKDIFPPAAPAGLTGLYTAGVVELIWNANTEPDLGGYNVYRRDNSGSPRRINSEVVGTPTFRDSSAEPRLTYIYWVTAVDLAGNESSPSQAVEVDTR